VGGADCLGDHRRRGLCSARDLAFARRYAAARGVGGRIRPPLILSHFLLAAGGLVLWVIYLAVDKDVLAWVAFVVLLVVAALGFTMFAIWLQRRRAVEPVAVGAAPATPAEQNFPVPIVALHGLLAATTLVLVLLTAAGVGGS
jgi:manganese efflux pump family protein